jgi:hypothetical protein
MDAGRWSPQSFFSYDASNGSSPAHQRNDLGARLLIGAEHFPGPHQLPPFLEQIASAVGGFDLSSILVVFMMREIFFNQENQYLRA